MPTAREAQLKFCTSCAEEIDASARFCWHCGAPVGTRKRRARNNDKIHGRDRHLPERAEIAPHAPSRIDAPPDDAGAPRAAILKGLPKADALRLIVRSVIKSGAKSLAISAAVLGPGFVLLFAGYELLGIVWLFVGAFGQMAWTYRKPWRLGLVSCLIPPVAVGTIYVIQLWLFESVAPPPTWVAAAMAGGGVLGWLRGREHVVYREGSAIFAQRTHAYLVIWAAAFGITQLLGFVTRETLLLHSGLVAGAFTTAMLAVVSIALLSRWNVLSTTTA
jgi:hypothetical protein